MTNDLTTLSGALLEMKDQLIYELGQKGVTATYDSTTGLLGLIGRISDIQTGGSCYHIEFSESSYTASGGQATLEILLQQNYAPLSGATVTVTGSDSSLYTGITDSTGKATVTVENITSGTTFTCSYNNVSDTCIIIAPLFYDPCTSSSGLSNYGSSQLVRGSTATITMTYNATENAYQLSGSGNYHAMIPITPLANQDNYTINMECKGKAIRYNMVGFFLDNSADTTSYGLCFGLDIGKADNGLNQSLYSRLYRPNSDGTGYITYLDSNVLTADTWYNLRFTVNGSTLTGALYDLQGNLIAEKTVTYTINNKSMGILLFCETGTTNSTCYVRNIVAEAL